MLVGLALGLALVAAWPGSLATSGTSHGGAAPAAVKVDATPSHTVHSSSASPVQFFLTLTTPLGTYTTLPTQLVVNFTVTNTTINTETSTLWLNVTDYTASTLCVTNNISYMITNSSVPTEYLSFSLSTAFLAGVTTACPNFLEDQAFINITGFVWDPVNGSATATAVQNGVYDPISALILSTPTSLLQVTPTSGQQQTYSLQASYTAQYVGKVTLYVYSGTALVFQASLRWNGTTPTVVTWHQSVSGVYPYTLAVFTAYGTYNTTGSIFVPALTPVYYSNATFHNTTLIPGLSSGAAGTILLVVGLIVGMLVATVVGRLVWGGSKAAAPAQPWDQKAATSNVCSVCGKSFATPEELAEHSKTEHGIQS